MADELSSGLDYLRLAAMEYFGDVYEHPPMTVDQPLDTKLSWVPTFFFTVNDHIIVACEISASPYPMILELRRKDIEEVQKPISVYCICPEEAYLSANHHGDAKRLMQHGFGLLTVDQDRNVQLRASGTPLVHQILPAIFKEEIKSLPPKLKRRLAESFDHYRHSAPGGVADLSEVVEGLVLRAGRDAAQKIWTDPKDNTKKTWINPKDAKPGYPAATIDALLKHKDTAKATAALGGVRSYLAEYRNTSAHFPKDKKQAYVKYHNCKHAFIEGLKKIRQFQEAMQVIGLTGLLPKI